MKIIHLECKAMKDAIKYWQYYQIGREFIVGSDHKPSRNDEILGDLIHYLSQFNFKIIYKKGKENVLADLLYIQPVLEYFETEDAIHVVNLVELKEIIDDQNKNSKIDDILIFSKSWEEHMKHVERLLQVIDEEGFKLKLEKCIFASNSVKYLGHMIREKKISPTQENLIAIKILKRPTNKSEVEAY